MASENEESGTEKKIVQFKQGFRLFKLEEVREKYPGTFAPFKPKHWRPLLVPGRYVKLYIEAVGMSKPCAEFFWAVIEHFDRKTGQITAVCSNRMERDLFHGVKMGQILKFNSSYVIDVNINE